MIKAKSSDGGARNAGQVRADIDSGRTNEKVAASDPAAAPLGTDAEAGGAGAAREEKGPAPPPQDTTRRRRLFALALLLAVLMALAVVLALGAGGL